jgi:hypothetical protein
MMLYHWTTRAALPSIFKQGLRPNGLGIVYLTPDLVNVVCGDVCLEVETGGLRLTAFEGCEDREVLCWGHIPPESVKEV